MYKSSLRAHSPIIKVVLVLANAIKINIFSTLEIKVFALILETFLQEKQTTHNMTCTFSLFLLLYYYLLFLVLQQPKKLEASQPQLLQELEASEPLEEADGKAVAL